MSRQLRSQPPERKQDSKSRHWATITGHGSERGQGNVERPIIPYPEDGAAVQDTTRLSLVVLSPIQEWAEDGSLRQTILEWTRNRGSSPRLYPGSLIWCIRKPGRELRNKVEILLAWRNVNRDYILTERFRASSTSPTARRSGLGFG